MKENELYPGQADELRKREELRGAQDRAHAAVLPGALREAFAGEPTRVKIIKDAAGNECNRAILNDKLEPVTLGLTANLERIKSPLLEVVRIMREVFSAQEVEKPEGEGSPVENPLEPAPIEKLFAAVNERVAKVAFQEEQIAETVFIFTRPQKRVRKLLDAGRDKFREAAMEELGDKLHPMQMGALQQACAQHYIASFATIIAYESPAGDGEVVFRPPSPGAATGSAGG